MMTMPFESSVCVVRADTGCFAFPVVRADTRMFCVSRCAGRHGGLPLQWPFQLHEP